MIDGNNCIVDEPGSDDYGHTVMSGVRFLKGYFMERIQIEKNTHPLLHLVECKKRFQT